MMEFVNEFRRKSWNFTNRNQMSFYVFVDDIRLSKPLRQHSVNLSEQDPAKHVNTSLTERCEVLSDHCTFCTGLLSNPPRTVNPVSSVFFGISSFDSTSCCSWRSSPLTPEFLRSSVDVTKIHKPNLSKLFLQLYDNLDVTLMYILPFERK